MLEELFERILGYMHIEGEDGAAQYTNIELGYCPLVCRYWAQRCQPKIFCEIEIRCAEDARQLLAMLERPGSRIAQYIEVLRLSPLWYEPTWFAVSTFMTPWFHFMRLLHAKLGSCYYSLFLAGPRPGGMRTLRSIHWNLPRTFPAHSRGLRTLRLYRIEFHSFRDLVHLLDELPDLRELHCEYLTWVLAPPLTTLRANRPRTTSLESVRLSHCPCGEHVLWLLSVYRAGTPLVHVKYDLTAIIRTVQTILWRHVDHAHVVCAERDLQYTRECASE